MKKYILLVIAPVLFQGALYASQANQVMQPGLQNIKELLKNPMIANDLDSVLNGLLDAVKNGAVGKDAAIAKVEDLQKALENFKAQQYPNYFMSWFVSTPDIVKNEIQPALDKVNKVLAELKNNAMSVGAIVGWTALGIGAAAVVGTAALGITGFRMMNSLDAHITNWDNWENIALSWAEGAANASVRKNEKNRNIWEAIFQAALQRATQVIRSNDIRKFNPKSGVYDATVTLKAKKAVFQAASEAYKVELTRSWQAWAESKIQSGAQSPVSEDKARYQTPEYKAVEKAADYYYAVKDLYILMATRFSKQEFVVVNFRFRNAQRLQGDVLMKGKLHYFENAQQLVEASRLLFDAICECKPEFKGNEKVLAALKEYNQYVAKNFPQSLNGRVLEEVQGSASASADSRDLSEFNGYQDVDFDESELSKQVVTPPGENFGIL